MQLFVTHVSTPAGSAAHLDPAELARVDGIPPCAVGCYGGAASSVAESVPRALAPALAERAARHFACWGGLARREHAPGRAARRMRVTLLERQHPSPQRGCLSRSLTRATSAHAATSPPRARDGAGLVAEGPP